MEDFLLANKKTMDTGEITIGEVVNLLYCDGKKSYIVAYTIGGNQMCIKPSSSEEYIKFSSKRAKENTIAAEARISEISGSESCSNVTNNELSSKRQRGSHVGHQSHSGSNGATILQDDATNRRIVEGPDDDEKHPTSSNGSLLKCNRKGCQGKTAHTWEDCFFNRNGRNYRPELVKTQVKLPPSRDGVFFLLEDSFDALHPILAGKYCVPFLLKNAECNDSACWDAGKHIPFRKWDQVTRLTRICNITT